VHEEVVLVDQIGLSQRAHERRASEDHRVAAIAGLELLNLSDDIVAGQRFGSRELTPRQIRELTVSRREQRLLLASVRPGCAVMTVSYGGGAALRRYAAAVDHAQRGLERR
jgi:hypothetical protein